MTWFKVDDGFAFHPKAIEAGNAALGLWVRAGAWCGANLTDGALPKHMIGTFGAQARDAKKLVSVGLWVETPTGYAFHEWTKMQPSKAEVEAEREANRKRQKEWRENKKKRNAVTNGVTDTVSNAASNAAPSRPVPSLTEANASVKEFMSDAASGADAAGKQYGPEVRELCEHLSGWIVRNGNRKPTVGQQWLQACDRLIRLDGVTPADVRGAIDWSQQNEFWRANILSMPKLRDKYDQLRLAAQRPTGPPQGQPRPSTTQSRLQTGQTMVERLKAKEEQREQAQQQELLQIGNLS